MPEVVEQKTKQKTTLCLYLENVGCMQCVKLNRNNKRKAQGKYTQCKLRPSVCIAHVPQNQAASFPHQKKREKIAYELENFQYWNSQHFPIVKSINHMLKRHNSWKIHRGNCFCFSRHWKTRVFLGKSLHPCLQFTERRRTIFNLIYLWNFS